MILDKVSTNSFGTADAFCRAYRFELEALFSQLAPLTDPENRQNAYRLFLFSVFAPFFNARVTRWFFQRTRHEMVS